MILGHVRVVESRVGDWPVGVPVGARAVGVLCVRPLGIRLISGALRRRFTGAHKGASQPLTLHTPTPTVRRAARVHRGRATRRTLSCSLASLSCSHAHNGSQKAHPLYDVLDNVRLQGR